MLIEKYIRRTNSFIDNNGSSRCDRVYKGVFCGVYIIDLKNFNKHWKLHEMLYMIRYEGLQKCMDVVEYNEINYITWKTGR